MIHFGTSSRFLSFFNYLKTRLFQASFVIINVVIVVVVSKQITEVFEFCCFQFVNCAVRNVGQTVTVVIIYVI